MSIKVYVPRDSAALAAGADEVAAPLRREARKRGIGLSWCATVRAACSGSSPWSKSPPPQGRIAYGPVDAGDVAGLFDASFLTGGAHALQLGLTEDIPYLRKQERLTFARMGVTDPLSLADYQAHEGYAGLRKALALPAPRWCSRCWTPACAAAAARPFRPASNGKPWRRCRPRKNTWSAMPTRATPAPTPTA
jgi:formate dehydrogenase iron-sulfur subunit